MNDSEPLPSNLVSIEIQKEHDILKRSFQERVVLKLSSALRSSRLLATLPAEEFKALIALCLFTDKSGHCHPNPNQLAGVLGVSEQKARETLERLCQFRWQGGPLVVKVSRPNNGEGYSFLPQELPATEETLAPATPTTPATPAKEPLSQAGIESSLVNLGVSEDWAHYLAENYPLESIRRQIEWLPYRNPRNKAAMIQKAIQEDWEGPKTLRTQPQVTAEEGR